MRGTNMSEMCPICRHMSPWFIWSSDRYMDKEKIARLCDKEVIDIEWTSVAVCKECVDSYNLRSKNII